MIINELNEKHSFPTIKYGDIVEVDGVMYMIQFNSSHNKDSTEHAYRLYMLDGNAYFMDSFFDYLGMIQSTHSPSPVTYYPKNSFDIIIKRKGICNSLKFWKK